jgi:hypothetical protein
LILSKSLFVIYHNRNTTSGIPRTRPTTRPAISGVSALDVLELVNKCIELCRSKSNSLGTHPILSVALGLSIGKDIAEEVGVIVGRFEISLVITTLSSTKTL